MKRISKRMVNNSRGFFPLLLCLLLFPPGAVASDDRVVELMRQEIEEIRLCIDQTTGDSCLASTTVLPDFYEMNRFQPAWNDPDKVEQLLIAARGVYDDGLNPEDYHVSAIERLRREIYGEGRGDSARIASLDLLLTDSMIRLMYHLVFGKEDPNKHNPQWNLNTKIDAEEPVVFIQESLASGSLSEVIKGLKPRHRLYANMKGALARYRDIQSAGGWVSVPPGPPLRKGDAGARIVLLTRRLQITGDFCGEPADPAFFDEFLKRAVIRFQERHQLARDGVVGKNTLSALNVPVQERIDQLRVNLERLRWVLRDVPESYLIADIAGYHLYYIENGKERWRCRTQVGKPYRQTPAFKSKIVYVVFNPKWTIPPTILAEDVLPAVKKDIGYLKKHRIRVISYKGDEIDPYTLDWSAYGPRYFPFLLRQDPGPDNALGRIKFIFPNTHQIYLHDTPKRELFGMRERASSSGCIRVEKPFELAEILLKDGSEWDTESINKVIEGMETRSAFLPEPVPILLLYFTAYVEVDGTVRFLKDIYDRDKSVLEGLDSRFMVGFEREHE